MDQDCGQSVVLSNVTKKGPSLRLHHVETGT